MRIVKLGGGRRAVLDESTGLPLVSGRPQSLQRRLHQIRERIADLHDAGKIDDSDANRYYCQARDAERLWTHDLYNYAVRDLKNLYAELRGITAHKVGGYKYPRLSSIRVLWRQPDTMSLWGIPYLMRPGQQPYDLWRAHHDWTAPKSKQTDISDWSWLGCPGWWGDMPKARQRAVKHFLARHIDYIPNGPMEWDIIR